MNAFEEKCVKPSDFGILDQFGTNTDEDDAQGWVSRFNCTDPVLKFCPAVQYFEHLRWLHHSCCAVPNPDQNK